MSMFVPGRQGCVDFLIWQPTPPNQPPAIEYEIRPQPTITSIVTPSIYGVDRHCSRSWNCCVNKQDIYLYRGEIKLSANTNMEVALDFVFNKLQDVPATLCDESINIKKDFFVKIKIGEPSSSCKNNFLTSFFQSQFGELPKINGVKINTTLNPFAFQLNEDSDNLTAFIDDNSNNVATVSYPKGSTRYDYFEISPYWEYELFGMEPNYDTNYSKIPVYKYENGLILIQLSALRCPFGPLYSSKYKSGSILNPEITFDVEYGVSKYTANVYLSKSNGKAYMRIDLLVNYYEATGGLAKASSQTIEILNISDIYQEFVFKKSDFKDINGGEAFFLPQVFECRVSLYEQ